MFFLENDRLRVEIAEPGESPNNGFRFDRAGFLPEVVLDGAVHFCANEPHNLIHPSSKGRGLCCEYTADYSEETEEGEYYPKLGIGLIRKEGPYSFCAAYKDVKAFPVRIARGDQNVTFETEAVPCLGYGLYSKKTVTIRDNHLSMGVILKNVGEKEIITGEYCHNFLSIDGMAVSPDYRLDFPDLPGLDELEIPNEYPTPCNFVGEAGGIAFARSELSVSLAKLPLEGMTLAEGRPFSWRLSHKGAKAYVEVQDYIRPSGITLWSVDHIVSPEIIHTVAIKPGEVVSWKRCWTFEKDYE